MIDPAGNLVLVDVADVGVDALAIHDESRSDPGLAMALSRLSMGLDGPTAFGVFRSVDAPIHHTQGQFDGPGSMDDLEAMMAGNSTWTVA
jgi:2-oxoglutarate ferredoxin oxidoreductase subunit beta